MATTTKKSPAKKTVPKREQKAIPDKTPKEKQKELELLSYGSTDDKSLLALIQLVREGIPFNDFFAIASDTPFTMSEWADYLQLSERTIQRLQKEKKAFQPIQSERIVELAMLYKYGVEVFGDKENFNTWLNTKSVALGGRVPKQLLDTTFGVSMLKDAIGRIEHGVLA